MYVNRELFGGAITADIPVDFVDISALREVPDNQECYSHPDSDKSLIVEILEYEGGVENEKAADFFFTDLADANGSTSNSIESNQPAVPGANVPCQALDENAYVSVVVGTQMVAKFREAALNSVRIFLCVVRLPKFASDILITMNVPISVDPQSSSAALLNSSGLSLQESPEKQAADMQIFSRMLQTLDIRDPGLFGH